MEDEKYPYFFANNILVHNSLFLNFSNIVEQRYGNDLPDDESVIKFLLKYQELVVDPTISEFFVKLKDTLNMFELSIEMEHEGIYKTALFVEKKKYCLAYIYADGKWYLDKPKMKIKGIEVVRTSTPACVRKKLEEAINLIFTTRDNEILIDFIDEFKKEFFELPFESVAAPRGVKFSSASSIFLLLFFPISKT